jgi:hypothetical protein
MNALPDENTLTQARLCELAEVERGRHSRWQGRELLAKRRRYSFLDLLQAAQLDELSQKLGPRAAARVWEQVRSELGVAGKRLEVVVNLATFSATLARSDRELASAVPRGEKAMVVDLTERSARARERFGSFSQAAPTQAGAAQGPSAEASERPA